MVKLIYFVTLTILVTGAIYSYSPMFGDYFSIGIGELLEENNPFFNENITIIEISDSIKLSEIISGNAQLIFSFPDERISFFKFTIYGSINLWKFEWIIKPSIRINVGFENSSYFVKTKITNEIPFKYYGIFTPYFSSELKLETKIIKEIFLNIGWFGGMPILFLPNKIPSWGLPLGYYLVSIGIKEIILDEISFYYDVNMYLFSITKKF
ncbi:MAG: hypothetical protein ACK4F9_03230 [Brevinematia bacterium]